jgi:hypothetical protein
MDDHPLIDVHTDTSNRDGIRLARERSTLWNSPMIAVSPMLSERTRFPPYSIERSSSPADTTGFSLSQPLPLDDTNNDDNQDQDQEQVNQTPDHRDHQPPK